MRIKRIFVFSTTLALVIFGVVLFGVIVGVQETIMKAVVADITPIDKRSSGYGIFNLSFGLAVFIGSTLAGFLYDHSITTLIITLAAVEIAAIPIFYLMRTTCGSTRSPS